MKNNQSGQQREYPTFSITYWGEDEKPKEVIQVRPVPLRGKSGMLRDVITMQNDLIKDFVYHNACIGALVNDDVVWKKMVVLAKILPVVGRAEPGFEIESLAECGDIGQLGSIFFTESITPKGEHELGDNGERPLTKPSAIARIHDINFHTPLFRFDEERREQLHKERMDRLGETIKEQVAVSPAQAA